MSTLIIIAIIAIAAILTMSVYNKLIKLRNLVKNSFSQIDIQLKRRYDLIPNLVETAKAYMKHEKETLESVIQARNQAYSVASQLSTNPADAANMQKLMSAESSLAGALSKLMMVAEQYPDLKANATMSQLMEELTSTENKISFARQAFNDSVMEYNNIREQFPNNIISNFFSFDSALPFELTNSAERENTKVNFA